MGSHATRELQNCKTAVSQASHPASSADSHHHQKQQWQHQWQNEKDCDEDDKDDVHDIMPPPNFIQISQGRIQLVHQPRNPDPSDTGTLSLERINGGGSLGSGGCDKDLLEKRMIEVEGALLRLQKEFHKSQCGSPTFEKELREQIENMNRIMKSKERKQMQTCRDHKALQTRFARQESLLHSMQQENRSLLTRIRQYEHCLDDVMRKVVDAIVAEDNLREEVSMLKGRVRDLEAQNAALSASPVKGRDEGYCTMSSGQPQPSNGHLEDLPEEPEQWISLFQIVYSEDEEVACTDFTDDFYKLVNIRSNSSRSLYSYLEGETDDEDDDDEADSSMSESQAAHTARAATSPTPSEAGRAQLTSCSSSETDENSISHPPPPTESHQEKEEEPDYAVIDECRRRVSDIEIEDVPLIMSATPLQPLNEQQCIAQIIKSELRRPPHVLVKSKSVLEEQEPSCILRHNQRRELESTVVRSDSISCALMAKIAKEAAPPSPAIVSKLKERILNRQFSAPATSSPWRRSNGWKRVTSPVQIPAAASPKKKQAKSTELPKSCLPKAVPTRIPTSINSSTSSTSSVSSSSPSPSSSSPSPQSPQQQQKQQQQPRPSGQQQRKSKIPPPVPVRRSYAS
ncbi:GL16736 [Drosophila persimilis]|uniref:GL16736 n=1 Tax=Drosophila persimilis TaxID=7234 RepID=B4GIK3_DROPE|nr:GL16736 [Drosophila persimilis]